MSPREAIFTWKTRFLDCNRPWIFDILWHVWPLFFFFFFLFFVLLISIVSTVINQAAPVSGQVESSSPPTRPV